MKNLKMTSGWIFLLFCFWLLMLPFVFGDDIDTDYYYGSQLRSKDRVNCKDPFSEQYCQSKCQEVPGMCFMEQCFCVHRVDDKYVDRGSGTVVEDYTYYSRRHHIAHFCPNLEEARACIRTCMKQGKPAFCGKDHVCYCGHRYNAHSFKNDKKNPTDMYAEFRDMYEKYFGPNTEITEDKDDDGEKLKDKIEKKMKIK